MRPEWFSVPSSSADSPHPPIPFQTMWEETAEWLPILLGFYFPTAKGAEKAQMVHHASFKKGLNPQTGLQDIWHGMDENFIQWLGSSEADDNGYPERLEDWTEEIKGRWIEERRKARFNTFGVSKGANPA